MPEITINIVPKAREGYFFNLNRHRARLDLRKIKDVVDEV